MSHLTTRTHIQGQIDWTQGQSDNNVIQSYLKLFLTVIVYTDNIEKYKEWFMEYHIILQTYLLNNEMNTTHKTQN